MEATSYMILDIILGLAMLAVPVALGIAGAILFDIARHVCAIVLHGRL
jgi:hypothetical protein